MTKQIDIDARRIANEAVFGDVKTANQLWGEKIVNLKRFEMIALRDKVHSYISELERSKAQLENQVRAR